MDFMTRLREQTTQRFIPIQASLELTNRCNERCTHCYLETFVDDKKRLLSTEQWFGILDQLREAGTLYLILMGGEAMLSPHFWPILEKASKLGFHCSMITNGLKLQDIETVKRLKSLGMQQVTVSLYSLRPEVHDKMTQVRGSCRRTMKAVENCVEVGIEVGINCLLTRANVADIFELEDWCIEKKVQLKVDPNVTAKLNGDLAPTAFRASPEQIKWFYKERLLRWPNSRPKFSSEIDSSYVCNSAKGKCAITPYGELLPCIEIRRPLGQLTTEQFADAWNSDEAKKWRSIQVKDLDNAKKNLYGFCDHCPGMALNETGNPFKVSEFTYEVAQIKKDVAENP